MKKILLALVVSCAFILSAFAAVNINTATQQELESLDGVGPVKAKAIIDYRKKNGGFKSVDELEKVDGVGEVTLKNMRKDVSISGKSTVVTPATPSKSAQKTKPAKETAAKESKAKETKTKETKTKETKSVGTEKAAAAGKVADSKEVKTEKPATDTKKSEKKATTSKKPAAQSDSKPK